MQRVVIEEIKRWSVKPDRKPLILNGARQVGKTWLLQEVGQKLFESFVYINCDTQRSVISVFSKGFDPDNVLLELGAIAGQKIVPGKTFLVFDEVQSAPIVLSSLKYFCEQLPQLHVAVAGSLLGISLHEGVSFPVGKVDEIRVFPMSFIEFLMAIGEDMCAELVSGGRVEPLSTISDKMIPLLRQYFYVGGMPAAVKSFVDDKDLVSVRNIQRQILRDYQRDFSKHAPSNEVARINQVWQSVPSQLAKENKKFIFGALKKGARGSEYELAIQWLVDAGLLYRIPRVSKPEMPLKFYEELNAFKLFLLDLGLMGAMAETSAKQVIIDGIFNEYQGAFTEQYVFQQLLSLDKFSVYYHSSSDSRLEIDALVQWNSFLHVIEIKSGTSVRSNSLTSLLQKDLSLKGVRYSMLPYIAQERMTNYPLYTIPAPFIED